MMPTETCALLAFAINNSIAISSTTLTKFFIVRLLKSPNYSHRTDERSQNIRPSEMGLPKGIAAHTYRRRRPRELSQSGINMCQGLSDRDKERELVVTRLAFRKSCSLTNESLIPTAMLTICDTPNRVQKFGKRFRNVIPVSVTSLALLVS